MAPGDAFWFSLDMRMWSVNLTCGQFDHLKRSQPAPQFLEVKILPAHPNILDFTHDPYGPLQGVGVKNIHDPFSLGKTFEMQEVYSHLNNRSKLNGEILWHN